MEIHILSCHTQKTPLQLLIRDLAGLVGLPSVIEKRFSKYINRYFLWCYTWINYLLHSLFSPSQCRSPVLGPHWSFPTRSAHALEKINHAECYEYFRPCCLSRLSKFLAPKICLHWSFVFGMSWHSIAGLSFTSDFSFHGFEEMNEGCTASDSAAKDRPLGPSMSDHGEEQLSAWSDAASSRRQGKKRPREVSEKRSVSEAGGRKHDVTSKQHNGEAHHSFQVNSEKISHDTPRPKVGPTVNLRMSDADMNDLRFEALTSRINKVESYLEEIVQFTLPSMIAGMSQSLLPKMQGQNDH